MKKFEKGILTIEASIVLTLFTLFVLFIFNFASIYTVQNVVSHATIQAADAVALESYLRETAAEGDAEDIVHLTSQITDSSSISADSFESLRTADLPDVARQKFATAVSNSESKADEKLETLGVRDGLSGVDFNSSYVDLDNDDVIVAVTYTVDLQFPVFGAEEITLTKTAKAKTFGDILYGVTTKPNNPEWGVTRGDDEVEHGETVVITATPNHGYRFVSWNDGVTDNPRTVLVTEAKKYVAIFEPSGYGVNLSVNNANWGSVSGGGTYDYMATATITATPKKHYQFVGWDYNGDGAVDHTEPTRNIVVNKTYNIQAIFEPVSYTITVKSNNSSYGSALVTNSEGVSGTTITAKYGSYVTLSCSTTVADVYVLDKWTDANGNRVSNKTSDSVQVTGPATYTANFKLNTYTVSFYNGSTLYATVPVIKNKSISASAGYTNVGMPKSDKLGSKFARWKTDGGSTFNQETPVKDGDMIVYAEYKCTVTLNADGGTVNNKNTDTILVEKGKTTNLPTPKRNGYTFKGWYTQTGGSGTNHTSGTVINGDVTLYAYWSCNHKYDSGESMKYKETTVGDGKCSGCEVTTKCKGCNYSDVQKMTGKHEWGANCGKDHPYYWKGECTNTKTAHEWKTFRCITCKHCGACKNVRASSYELAIGLVSSEEARMYPYFSGKSSKLCGHHNGKNMEKYKKVVNDKAHKWWQ